jgi:hypothetical protein
MGRIATRSASSQEIASIYDDVSKVERSRVVERDGVVLAVGLLVRQVAHVVYRDAPPRVEHRLWLNFDTYPGAGCAALAIVRASRDMTTGIDEPVYALCDEIVHATAPQLLRLCGFAPTPEIWSGTSIWLKSP